MITRSQSRKSLLGELPDVLQRSIIELILDYAKTELLLSSDTLAEFRDHPQNGVRFFVTDRRIVKLLVTLSSICVQRRKQRSRFAVLLNFERAVRKIPSYKDPPNEKAYKGKEELKYWKRRFDAWCCGRALVDSEGPPYSFDAASPEFIQFFGRERPGEQRVRIQNEKPNEVRRAVREYMMLLVNFGPDTASIEHTLGPIEDWYVEDVTNMSHLFDQELDADASELNTEGIFKKPLTDLIRV